MLLQCASFRLLLLLCALIAPAFSSPNYRHFCPHCEEEVWEEVPCNQISTRSTTTTTTTARPTRTTFVPTTQRISTTPRPSKPTQAPTTHSTTTSAPMPSTTPSAYQNCYYECKGGCKEFCRKVTVNGASEKQITQITKTSHRVPNGQLNSEHVHQHIFVPNPHVSYTPAPPTAQPSAVQETHPPVATNELGSSYKHTQLAYKIQPAPSLQPTLPATYAPASQPFSIYENPQSESIYSEAMLDASYSVDELTRILQMENFNRNSATAYYQPAVYASSYISQRDAPPPNTIPLAAAYQLPLPEPKYAPSAPSTGVTNNSYLARPQYETVTESSPATPGPSTGSSSSSATHFTNYVSKGYSNGSAQYSVASESNKDQQSAPSVAYHDTYSNPSGEYDNSAPHRSLAYAYAPQHQSYAM